MTSLNNNKQQHLASVLSLMLISLVLAIAGASEKDEGYEALFNSFTDDIPETCFPLKAKSLFRGEGEGGGLQGGTWIIPSVSGFEIGSTNFTSVLDGYGKLNKFSFDTELTSVCYTSRMLASGFYNLSMDLSTVAPSVLFMPTSPAGNYSPAQILGEPCLSSHHQTHQLSLSAPPYHHLIFLIRNNINKKQEGQMTTRT